MDNDVINDRQRCHANITIVKSGLSLTNANYLIIYLPQVNPIFKLQWLKLIVL